MARVTDLFQLQALLHAGGHAVDLAHEVLGLGGLGLNWHAASRIVGNKPGGGVRWAAGASRVRGISKR